MSYYDSVKNNIDDSNDTSKPNFDTLRKAAEQNSESEDEREGDDTDIEVLEDGLGERKSESSGIEEIGSNDNNNKDENKETGRDQENRVKTSSLEEKLDTIIEQNDEMIKILKGFGS